MFVGARRAEGKGEAQSWERGTRDKRFSTKVIESRREMVVVGVGVGDSRGGSNVRLGGDGGWIEAGSNSKCN